MPRVKPRLNVYGVLPILACLITAGAIAVTWLRIEEYRREQPARKLPPLPGPEIPDIERPKLDEKPAAPAEGAAEKKEEAAPTEGGPKAKAEAPAPAPAPAEGGVEPKKDAKGAPPPGEAKGAEERK